jgi:hypothetical protein
MVPAEPCCISAVGLIADGQGLLDGIMVPVERIERSELHPSIGKLFRHISRETTRVRTDHWDLRISIDSAAEVGGTRLTWYIWNDRTPWRDCLILSHVL